MCGPTARRAGRFISAIGLNDLYHAPWFVLIMALLAANLVICSLNRLSLTLRILGKDPAAEAGSMRKAKDSFTLSGEPSANLEKARRVLERLVGASAPGQGHRAHRAVRPAGRLVALRGLHGARQRAGDHDRGPGGQLLGLCRIREHPGGRQRGPHHSGQRPPQAPGLFPCVWTSST